MSVHNFSIKKSDNADAFLLYLRIVIIKGKLKSLW